MFKLLIDTGVWVDIARSSTQHPLLSVLETLVGENRLGLIVPRIVVDDFRRQRNQMAREGVKRISTYFEMIDAGILPFRNRSRSATPVAPSLPDEGTAGWGAPGHILDRIEALLAAYSPVEATPIVKRRVTERKVARQAPFDQDPEAYRAAQILEIYADSVQSHDSTKACHVFVTSNSQGFSESEQRRERPHPHIGALFQRPNSRYFVTLAEALGEVAPDLSADALLTAAPVHTPTHLQAMIEAEELLSHQVRYHHHWEMLERISSGSLRVVEDEAGCSGITRHGVVTRSFLRDAIQAAKETERRYTKRNLGPWDPFEFGVLSGRLSALRWILRDHPQREHVCESTVATRKPAACKQGARHTIPGPIDSSSINAATFPSN